MKISKRKRTIVTMLLAVSVIGIFAALRIAASEASHPWHGGAAQEAPQAEMICTLQIRCDDVSGTGILTANGYPQLERYAADSEIVASTQVVLEEGSSVYDALRSVCRDRGIAMESSYSPAYDSYYIEGIHHLYEFQAGNNSGWVYRVNGQSPNYACSAYILHDGDEVVWQYTCNRGNTEGGDSE